MKERRDRPLLFLALLNRLDDARDRSELCNHYEIECRIHSSWQAVESLLKTTIDNGWVEFDEKARIYRITDAGRLYLSDLRRILPPAYSRPIQDFLGRRA